MQESCSSVRICCRLLLSGLGFLVFLPLDVVVNGRLMLRGAWNLRQHFYASQIIVHE